MVCQTCGSSGHNTTTCPRRKVAETVSQFVMPVGGRQVAKVFLETPAQKEYRNRK